MEGKSIKKCLSLFSALTLNGAYSELQSTETLKVVMNDKLPGLVGFTIVEFRHLKEGSDKVEASSKEGQNWCELVKTKYLY